MMMVPLTLSFGPPSILSVTEVTLELQGRAGTRAGVKRALLSDSRLEGGWAGSCVTSSSAGPGGKY